jgi:hypothetical protein
MPDALMKDTFRTVCLALTVGALAGAGAANYVLATGAHSKIGLEFNRENGREHLELGHLVPGDATGRPPRFWGLQVGNGDSVTTIGVYSGRTVTGARNIASAQAMKSSPHLPE